ncbi:hypothetical protein [Micromonospora fulviviridis]|uniref:Uncharacterized protein n=1 Tax=Micromonospora fulviviridis TaxID=47860 RepID=A0ABV2VCD1_9ACTN
MQGTLQVGAADVDGAQVGPRKVDVHKPRAAEVAFPQAGAAEVDILDGGPDDSGVRQVLAAVRGVGQRPRLD